MSSTASAARIAANKANAQKSTGPRTSEGKAAIANNAFKHGLRSERNPLDLATDTALPFEREELESTLAAFKDDLQPAGPLETRLVERLAQLDLRLNRAIRMETAHLEMQFGLMAKSMAGSIDADEQTQRAWITTLAFLKNPSATALLAQYESRLSRDFARTLTQIRQAQSLRAKEEAQKLRLPDNALEMRNQTQPTPNPAVQVAASGNVLPDQRPVPEHQGAATSAPPQSSLASPENPANQTQRATENTICLVSSAASASVESRT